MLVARRELPLANATLADGSLERPMSIKGLV